MAQLISVKLSRFDGSPWGFRLQGGKDFGTPLVVQKVNSGSLAEVAGLRAGDAVVRVNSTDMYNLRHKDAQDVIMRAGNNFEITVQRGGSTWKPSVTPVSSGLPSPVANMPGNITPVTKTSLAAKKTDGPLIGSGHNFSPKPFLNGSSDGPIKSIVNKQYNSPVGIYSEETIAETLSAQAEVLAGGVLGVNFKKNEKNYNAENSEVFKMVQEADKEPKTPEPAEPTTQSGVITPSSPALSGLRPVSAPETRPQQPTTPQSSLPPGQNICAECERLIVGVFVRIKEKNLHVECFKCSTCGTSLKNVGYYNINNKLYCDIHAKLVARQNAPAAGLVPITMPPGGKAPASTISAALANAPMSPPLSNHGSSPQPLSACNRTSHDHGSAYHPARSALNRNGCVRNGECNGYESKTFTSTITIQTGGTETPTSSLIGPKPFGAPSSILSTPSTPTLNSGSTLPRPQSQTVTAEVYEQSSYYETVRETTSPLDNPVVPPPHTYSQPHSDPHTHSYSMPLCDPPCNPASPSNTAPSDPQSPASLCPPPIVHPARNPTSVKSKSLAWPPSKPIEDITYPTASPLYIDPNPKFERGSRQALRDKRASIEACERVLSRKRAESIEREEFYREEYTREDAMDRVSCPGGPVYRKVELIETSSQRSRGECQTDRSRASTESPRRSLTPTRIVQPIPKPWTPTPCTGGKLYEKSYAEPPKVCKTMSSSQREVCHRERVCKRERMSAEQPYAEEQTTYRAEVCRMEQTISKPPLPAPTMIRQEESAESMSSVQQEETHEVARTDVEESKESVSPKGVGEHDLITETTEEDVGNMHVKTTSTFEKTVEPLQQEEEEEECMYTRMETVEREQRGNVTEQRTVTASAETVSSAVDATQLCEEAKRAEEEERKRQEEEERRKEREEEERKRREEEERQKREEERRRREEEERNKKHVSFEDDSEEIVEEIIEKPLGRTVVHEERITEEDGGATGRNKVIKETYEEVVEEVLVQERIRRRDVGDDQRRKSLREQVEVHQSLRDQERRQSQDRRVTSKYEQPQETMEMSKKHVQFMKQTDSGPRPIPHSALRENATPKEWKSEMVNALTTAPDRPFTPLSTSSSVKELYTEETIYLDHRGRARLPRKDEPRPVSPFQKALTIAPERPYTPLSREIGPDDQNICRSETPVCYGAKEGPCPPLDILYGDATFKETCIREQHHLKKSTCTAPRPLPTPPPDFRLRDTSPSPARSRSQTPSRPFSASLKKPDAIPSYQKNLVAMRKGPVESQQYIPSRTPTPTPCRSKSPGQAYSPSPSPCYSRAQAPRIRQDSQTPPPCAKQTTHFPSRRSVTYKVDEDTDTGHVTSEYAASRTAHFDEKDDGGPGSSDAVHAQYQERRIMTTEEQSEEQTKQCHTKRSLQVVEDFERCERRKPAVEAPALTDADDFPPSVPSTPCAIAKTCTRATLPCPLTRQARPTYTSSTEVRHVRYDDSAKSCPDTGVTVLPCKAHSDAGTRAGVVVVPCEGPKPKCAQTGVCVVPTSDRAGVCVSPCFGMPAGTCGQPSGCCGQRMEVEVPRNCPEAGICVAPCADGSVCVAPCKKQGARTCSRGGASSNVPFPQIPMPYEEFPGAQTGCPVRGGCTQGRPTNTPRCEQNTFGPNPAARTNLSGQLARLTAKRDVPTIQLYKAQCQADDLCCESFSRTTQSQCQTWSQCQTQNCQTQKHCQDQMHCTPCKTQSLVDPPNLSSPPDIGSGVGGLGGAGSKSGSFAGSSAPKRGRGILNQAGGAGSRVPLCAHCNSYVRGPFITALGQIWCPDHFVCVNTQCRRPLQDIGFVEEKGQLYCEYCFERFIAPTCNKCNNKIKGDCLNAIGKHFHPECFSCAYCGKLFGNRTFFLEEGLPYCEADWNELFTTKCFACGFPVEAGDRWVEALNNNYHSQCFNCTMCKKNLEGQSFYAKGGRPFCKNHAR